jgi:predicted ferric reductase
VLVLLRRNVGRRRVPGRVLAVRRHARLDVVEVDLELQGRWPGHAAGQFAFVTLHRAEGAHPYTIATDWREDGRLIAFAILSRLKKVERVDAASIAAH